MDLLNGRSRKARREKAVRQDEFMKKSPKMKPKPFLAKLIFNFFGPLLL
jgi:hypothetical protein